VADVRLQKVVARAGVASRRAAERLITEGRVRVNGRIVTELGTRVDSRKDKVEVDGRRLVREKPVYVVLHKPRGVVSTMHDPEGRPTVKDLIAEVGARVYPIGRLDFNTSGVLLLTNDGELCDGLLHPKRDVPKVYVAKVAGEMSEADILRWTQGVELSDGRTRPAKVRLLRYENGKTWLEVTLLEGRNQQIRRMGEETGFAVMRLSRLSFAGIGGEGLRPGQYRALSQDELMDLKTTYGVPSHVPRSPSLETDNVRSPAKAPHGRLTGGGRPRRRVAGG
jgi:23S rRNA pseudouridine2605 synthase